MGEGIDHFSAKISDRSSVKICAMVSPATHTFGRPHPDDFPAYAQKYIDLVSGEDALAILTRQLDAALPMLRGISEERSMHAYATGKWTIKEVVAHTTDLERVFGYRILSIARGDRAELPGIDEDTYAERCGAKARRFSGAPSALVEEFVSVRQSSLTLLAGLPPEAWSHRGTANQSSVTVRGLAFLLAGHAEHHLKLLREKYLS